MDDKIKSPKYSVVKTTKGDYLQPPFVTQEIFDSAVTYRPESSDVFVATYPKNGTSWMLYIMHMLHGRSTDFQNGDSIFTKYASLDFVGAQKTRDFPVVDPRLIKTHYMYEFVPKSDEAKYIFVARNPKDTVVSFFFHTVGFPFYEYQNEDDFDHFFRLFVEGRVDFGDYFEMVPEWWRMSGEKSNIHFLLYEDLKTDFEGEVLKIAEFLGNGMKDRLLQDDKKMLKEIAVKSDVKTMKNETKMNSDNPYFKRPDHLPFIRKGVIGDWKNKLSAVQSEIIDEKMKLAGKKYPSFDKLWGKYKNFL